MTEIDNRFRAGHYEKQVVGGYRAFLPRPLPPNLPLVYDNDLLALLSRADRALGRLDGATKVLPDPDLFVAMYVRKEAVLSSQIEGTQATLVDVLEFESGGSAPEHRDVEEVVNHIRAMNHGLARLEEIPVSLRLIREIHEHLMAGVRGHERSPGDFRTSQNWVGQPGSTIATATHVPPPPHALLEHLGHLESFIHATDPLPDLIKVGLVHCQFETIHPFLDGNGRVGRLLITFLLCEMEVMKRPLLYISHYFRAHKEVYYERLQAVRDSGDWEGWLKFFLEAVCRVSEEATETARSIAQMREDHRRMVAESFGATATKALALLESLYMQPVTNVNQVRRTIGGAYSNANTLVARLESMGLLREMSGQKRNRRFSYAPYLELLDS